MSIKIRCINCKEIYLGFTGNTKIRGPIIETTCSHCNKFVLKNLSAFLEQQFKHIDSILERTAHMLALGKIMEKHLSDESPSSKRKRQKRERNHDSSDV